MAPLNLPPGGRDQLANSPRMGMGTLAGAILTRREVTCPQTCHPLVSSTRRSLILKEGCDDLERQAPFGTMII